ncbi:inositol monophosphatase family protein, partial [Streptococcus sp. SPC0]|nr:inositol monophosphatase family protein [Streptococcus sp. SPC0]
MYKAGQFIKSEMQNTFDVEEKSRFDDLVTSLDKKTQKLLIQEIIQHYPDDNILAEEDDVRSPIAQGNVWVLDPIDGTVNFIVQKDNFAVMLAYYEEGVGQFGIIYDVMADILYSGGGHFD